MFWFSPLPAPRTCDFHDGQAFLAMFSKEALASLSIVIREFYARLDIGSGKGNFWLANDKLLEEAMTRPLCYGNTTESNEYLGTEMSSKTMKNFYKAARLTALIPVRCYFSKTGGQIGKKSIYPCTTYSSLQIDMRNSYLKSELFEIIAELATALLVSLDRNLSPSMFQIRNIDIEKSDNHTRNLSYRRCNRSIS